MFFNHDEIKTVSFPRGLKSIGDGAFAMCKGLSELLLPDSIEEIGLWAFRDCTGLRKIVLPAGLKSLRHGTFSFCYLADDVEIVFKEGLEKIESHIFYDGVGSAFSVELPRSVKEIAVGAFPPNVRINTELPYDRGWQMDWPYGEIVRKGSVEGRVDDYDKICKDCMILDVDFNGDHEKAFYPIDFWDEIFLFDDQKNTDISNRLHQEPGYEKKARAVYNGWKRGLY